MSLLMPVLAFASEVNFSVVNDASFILEGATQNRFSNRALFIVSSEFQPVEDLTVYLEYEALRGRNTSEELGIAQAYSNIDEQNFSRLYEAWLEYQPSSQIRYKVGQVDANTEFAVAENAGEFIHSSMGISPTVLFLPTYPTPERSANMFWSVSETSTLSFGVYANQQHKFSRPFLIAEWAQTFQPMTVKLGVWHKKRDIDYLTTGNEKRRTSGGYLVADGTFDTTLLDQLDWYVQYGFADKDVAEIKQHIGAGLSKSGVFGRVDDVMGIGLNHVRLSGALQDVSERSEMAWEVFYRYQLNDNFSVKPDIQWIHHPAFNTDYNNVLIATVRAELAF